MFQLGALSLHKVLDVRALQDSEGPLVGVMRQNAVRSHSIGGVHG